MKLNWAERWVVNNPVRICQQHFEIKWFQKSMPLAPGATVLELGCGRGAGAKLIHSKFKPAWLHILDLDIRMMFSAKNYLSSLWSNQISLYTGDAVHLPFRSDSMDAVFGFGFLHHVPNWRQALAEVARVLKSGGIYYYEELYPQLYQNFITKHILLHPEHNRFSSHDLRKALDQMHLATQKSFEIRSMGILGVATR